MFVARTDDPLRDADRYIAECDRWVSKRPVCSECDNPITTDELFEFNDELICPECLRDNHMKWTEDYVE